MEFMMEVMNNIGILQNLNRTSTGQVQNEYHFCTSTGLYLGALILPNDRQYLSDIKALNIITRATAIRWQLIQSKRQQ